jgi:hypothetical protein
MHFNPFPLAAAFLLFAAGTARAQEPPLRELLRDGLYAEEVTRDPESAAKSYEQVLARYSEQRAFAASALFRLAEVRRKQDRNDDAIQLYQRLLAEFPAATAETKLARENLAALGGKAPEASGPAGDAESQASSMRRTGCWTRARNPTSRAAAWGSRRSTRPPSNPPTPRSP